MAVNPALPGLRELTRQNKRGLTTLLALPALVVVFAFASGTQEARASAAPPSPPPAYHFAELDLPPGAAPLLVQLKFELLHLHAIDDEAETFDFSALLTLTWLDPGQAFDPVTVGAGEKMFSGDFQFSEVSPGWFPQVVITNALQEPDNQGVVVRVRPDGTSSVEQVVHVQARSQFELRRYPFDTQHLELHFQLLGFSAEEVTLVPAGNAVGLPPRHIEPPEWRLLDVGVVEDPVPATGDAPATLVVTMDIERRPLFMVRLVMLPLGLIVALSWVVFWMDRSSLGDRMAVSFVGILTAVAYQSMISTIMPHIAYVTFMNAFVVMCLFLMSATVLVNLLVAHFDKRGASRFGDRVDWHCRWLFPGLFAFLITCAWVLNSRIL